MYDAVTAVTDTNVRRKGFLLFLHTHVLPLVRNMKTTLLILALVSLAAAGSLLAYHVTPPEKQAAVSVPTLDLRITELEARVTQLENWAVKTGGRLK